MALTLLTDALSGLGRQVSGYLPRQQTTPGRFDTGAIIRADWGVDEPSATAGLVALSLWVHLIRRQYPALVSAEPGDDTLAERALLALGYLERAQRPGGLTDLRDCNYDSSPDAGFILQAILPPLLLLARRQELLTGDWEEIARRLTEFARKMTEGARTGGFHTPNHRWVIAAALHQAEDLFPEIPVVPAITAYLSEGVDIDEEGFYIERSAGVYDAICARSLYLLSDRTEFRATLRAAVEKNLLTDTFLLNSDGTVDTGLSRRQDAALSAAAPPLASHLAVPYLMGHLRAESEQTREIFLRIAQWLWDRTPPDRRDYYGMSQALLRRSGEPAEIAAEGGESSPSPLSSCVAHFPKHGLWRMRRGPLSVSVFRDGARLLNVRHGAAFLGSVSIHQSYFGVGQFLVDEMEAEGEERVRLLSRGLRHPYRPGYELPLGRPVPPEEWQEAKAERTIRRLPPAASELLIEPEEDGLRLRFRTLDTIDRATAQIAFDFPAGGLWETRDTCLEPWAGQTIFLKSGHGTMRYGNDALRIGPGADAHRMTQMRDAVPAAPGVVRVLMTFTTPIDHAFTITGGTWPRL